MSFGDDLARGLFGGAAASTNPSSYSVTNPMGGQINGMLGQQAAQAGMLDPTQQAQFRAMQLAQAQQLARIASGQQQGAGELAAQRQVQNALAAQQAQTRMARGGANAALAFRQGARNAAGIGLAGAGQAQQAALQDQQMAQGQLMGALGQGRGQDIGMAGQNAQIGLANAGMANDRYGQNLNALTGLNAQDLQAQYGAMNAALGQQGILGGLLNAGGQVLGAYYGGKAKSDRNLKTAIDEDAGDEVDEMLDRLSAKSYRYKDPKYGTGRRLGIMAQDLEQSKAGRQIVENAPDGKQLDVNKAISALLASAARLHSRLSKVEAKS